MPQAFPLTLWLHFTLPHQLSAAMGMSAVSVAKVEATLEAAAFGLLGVELSRTLGLSGAAAVVSVAGVIFGGSLAMFSGLEKSFGELAVLGTLLGICSLTAARHQRGALIGGLAFALALLIHRSALLFAPIYAWICLRCWQPATDRKWEVLVGAAAVLAALVISRADYARALQFDRGFGYFGWPASGLDVGLDSVDVANVLLLLCPLIPLVWVVRSQARIPILLLLSTILPGLVLLCGTKHSYHGLFRDWDIFTGALSPLFVLVAGSIGLGLQSHGRAAGRVAPAILAAAIVPTLFWLWAQADADRGFRQVHAFVTEGPLRSADVRGRSWQFLCSRYVDLKRFPEAVTAGRKAAELAPTHDLLLVLAGSERNAGDPRAALGTYRRVAALVPEDLVAWYNITTLSAELGDATAADDALARLGALGAPRDVVAYARALVQRRRRL